MKSVRLDKFLADMQLGTRSEVKKIIKKGQISIDGKKAVSPDEKIKPAEQKIALHGNLLYYEEFAYYMLYKPGGCVTAREDSLHPTVMDYIKEENRNLSPVGRLDLDTEGLLLVTNDGGLAHELLSPKKHVNKVYEARIDGKVTEEDISAFANGLDIGDDKPTQPAKLSILSGEESSLIRLTITEGRFHQVKRMFEAVGKQVTFLKRISMGTLVLDEALQPGEYRKLSQKEILSLKKKE